MDYNTSDWTSDNLELFIEKVRTLIGLWDVIQDDGLSHLWSIIWHKLVKYLTYGRCDGILVFDIEISHSLEFSVSTMINKAGNKLENFW